MLAESAEGSLNGVGGECRRPLGAEEVIWPGISRRGVTEGGVADQRPGCGRVHRDQARLSELGCPDGEDPAGKIYIAPLEAAALGQPYAG
jgi:hypothetical protein